MPPRFDKDRAEIPLSRRLHTERSIAQELAASQKMLQKRFNKMMPIEPLYRKPKKSNNQLQNNIKKNSNNSNYINYKNNNPNRNNRGNNNNKSKPDSFMSYNINHIRTPSNTTNNINVSYSNKNSLSNSNNNRDYNNYNNNNNNNNNVNKPSNIGFKSKSASHVLSPRQFVGKMIIDRDLLTREQHLSILATPKKKYSPRRRKKDKIMRF